MSSNRIDISNKLLFLLKGIQNGGNTFLKGKLRVLPVGMWLVLSNVFFAFLSSASLGAGSTGISVDEILDLPPVMKRALGTPPVTWATGSHTKIELLKRFPRRIGSKAVGRRIPRHTKERIQRVRVTVGTGVSNEQVQHELARRFVDAYLEIWTPSAKRFEFIRVDPERFVNIGVNELLGRAVHPVEASWWSVRMGERQEFCQTHVLIISNNFGGFDRFRIGHASVGLRQLGGDPFQDVVFDPRVPLAMDYHPSIPRVLFGMAKREIINGVRCYNLWDWIFAQNEERFVSTECHVIPVSGNQIMLMNAYAQDRTADFETGTYKIPTNNCADLTKAFFNAMLPVDQPLKRGKSPFQLPRVVVRQMLERTPPIAAINFPSAPEPEGLMETPNLNIEVLEARSRQLDSGRRQSPAFTQWKRDEARIKEILKSRRQ